MARLIQAIPTLEQIKDPESRRILTSVRSTIEAWAGAKGSINDKVLNVQELIDLGILGKDSRDRLYFINSSSTSTTTSTSSAVNASIAQQGWLTGKIDLTGSNAGDTVFLPVSIPPFARIYKTWYEVLTPFTAGSGVPTVGVKVKYDAVPSYTDLITASGLGVGWTTGVHDGIQDYTDANISGRTDNYYSIQADIAGTGDISAGIFRIFVHYFIVS